LHPIPEPQVTKPELLQENKNDIVGNKTLHCGKLMDMFKKFYKEHGQNEPLWLLYWMQEMHIANITLRICNQVVVIIRRQVNSIFECRYR
jgi:hypothetical protein